MTHKPTNETRGAVRLHAVAGTPQEVIADIMGVDSKTLRKHYRKELDHATAECNAVIANTLFRKAKSGDSSSMIFWMKSRAGWKTVEGHEHTGADGGAIKHEHQVAEARDVIASRLAGIAAARNPSTDS